MKAIIENDLIYLEEEETIPNKEQIIKIFDILKTNKNQAIQVMGFYHKIKSKLGTEEEILYREKIRKKIEITGNNEYVFLKLKEDKHDFSNHKLKEIDLEKKESKNENLI